MRFIIELTRRATVTRPAVRDDPPPSANPLDDDPCLIAPANRLVRLLDDRSGRCSRAVTVAELVNAIDDDWIVRMWALDVQRSSGAPIEAVLSTTLHQWIAHGEPLRSDAWLRVIAVDDDCWRTERMPITAPLGPIGDVAAVLLDNHSGRVIERDGASCIVAVPGFDLHLALATAPDRPTAVRVRTVVGERHHQPEHLRDHVEVVAQTRGLDDRLSMLDSPSGWNVWFETKVDHDVESIDALHASLWQLLQIADELRDPFGPRGVH